MGIIRTVLYYKTYVLYEKQNASDIPNIMYWDCMPSVMCNIVMKHASQVFVGILFCFFDMF